MEKIRVAYLVNQLAFGGTEKAVQLLAQNLDRSLFEPLVCGIYSGGYRDEILRKSGIGVFVAEGSFAKLRKFLEESRVDIAHVHRAGGREPMPIEAASEAGAKIILETNHFGDADFSESGRKLDFHIMISKFVAYRYMQKKRLSPDEFLRNATVIYNPVEINMIDSPRFSRQEIQNIREDLGIQDDYVIGRVGRAEAKWNDFPLEVASYLAKKQMRFTYLIVGGLPENIERGIRRRGLSRIFLDIGKVTDEELSKVYYVLDVLAHTSKRGETFGYTLAEAMAAERPVVVQSTPYADNAQLELVDNGYNGFVANTPPTYAEAIRELLINQELRDRMGKASGLRAREMFDSSKVTRAYERVYLHLLSRKYPNSEFVSAAEKLEDEIAKQKEDLKEYPSQYTAKLVNLFRQPRTLDRILTDLKYGNTYLRLESYYRRKIRKRLQAIFRRYT